MWQCGGPAAAASSPTGRMRARPIHAGMLSSDSGSPPSQCARGGCRTGPGALCASGGGRGHSGGRTGPEGRHAVKGHDGGQGERRRARAILCRRAARSAKTPCAPCGAVVAGSSRRRLRRASTGSPRRGQLHRSHNPGRRVRQRQAGPPARTSRTAPGARTSPRVKAVVAFKRRQTSR